MTLSSPSNRLRKMVCIFSIPQIKSNILHQVPLLPCLCYFILTGQYEPPMNISYRLRSSTPNSIRSNSLSRSSSMGSSPRMAPPLTTIKGDVIIPGSFDDLRRSTNRGPGSYFPTDETFSVTSSLTSPLRRKSFNVRSQNGNLLGHQSAMKQMISISQDDSFLHSPIKSKSIKKSTKTAWTHEKTPQTRIEYFTPRTTAISSKDDKINTPSNRFRSKYDTPYRSTSIPHQKHHHSSMISNPSPLPHGFHTPVH